MYVILKVVKIVRDSFCVIICIEFFVFSSLCYMVVVL